MYLLLNENNIIRCMSSHPSNLHKDKIAAGMRQVIVDKPKGTIGDFYDPNTDTWEAHPENYPQPSKEEIQEKKIQDEITRITREQAIRNLQDRNEL